MKKKIAIVAVALLLVAGSILGTLAYLTDRDSAENVFTVGKVDITLKENFTQRSKLMPGTTNTNAVQKEVWIELDDSSEDAYVWYEWLIPAALDSTDGSTGSNNIIHVNSLGRTWDAYRENQEYWADDQTEALPLDHTWDHDPDVELEGIVGPQGFVGTETIGGIKYNKYLVLYRGKLSGDPDMQTETTVAMSKVYMDEHVDVNADGQWTYNGNVIDYNFENGIKIIVRAYAIQAAGFNDVYAAYKAYVAQTTPAA